MTKQIIQINSKSLGNIKLGLPTVLHMIGNVAKIEYSNGVNDGGNFSTESYFIRFEDDTRTLELLQNDVNWVIRDDVKWKKSTLQLAMTDIQMIGIWLLMI